jgi:SpoVK/Ycf46/Vps4 family AAA+-type ATPase
MDEVKIIVIRFVFSVLTFLIISYLSSNGSLADLTNDLLATPDEREQRKEAQSIMDRAKRLFPQLDQEELTTHETIVTSSLVLPRTDSGMDQVGGHEKIKRELMLHVVVPLKNATTFFNNKALRPPTGILLSGPSGTGKTMLATALAHESNVPFMSIKPSMIEQKYYGESEKIVKAIFSLAKKIAPCIIFIDEIDGILKNRSAEFDQNANYSIKTQMLQEMDALEKENSYVIVIGATNCPTKLDKALYRRLPRTYTVDVPDEGARKQILTSLLSDEPCKKLKDSLIQDTEGFSGSDLKDMYKLASSIRNEIFSGRFLQSSVPQHVKPPPLTDEHWQEALERMYDARAIR